ncbi:MAG TPA: L-threonylcarbamoyladenylate synthase [Bacteroidia bacterium]|jgi:tRNA threonylcarbamoyl adenosine modification protein (Sua5/YciO/YrdC/YwlC family)|nr:L-threonylcarbamoyladenylate synthase [Bacteroidia bacterium]
MRFRINPNNILTENIYEVVDVLKHNGVIIYPTDSVYALGCSLQSPKAIEKIARLKKSDPDKINLSIICADLGQLSDYTRPLPNTIFRIMKKALPGPYTFILPASSAVPKLFLKENKKTIGIRVPDNAVCTEIVKILGCPLVSTSLHNPDDDLVDYYTDPENLYRHYKDTVDAFIDGGYGNIYPTTIVDCTGEEPVVTREGLGSLDVLS